MTALASPLPIRSLPLPLREHSGEQPALRLMSAVLEDALDIIRAGVTSPGLRRRAVFVETVEWIFSDDIGWPFSFRNLCFALDVNAHHLRAQVGTILRAAPPARESRVVRHHGPTRIACTSAPGRLAGASAGRRRPRWERQR